MTNEIRRSAANGLGMVATVICMGLFFIFLLILGASAAPILVIPGILGLITTVILAGGYPYDGTADHELSLRGSMDEVSAALRKELQERLAVAGVTIIEARLSHLAYAPEIANAMLRRQQAEAVVAARTRIVEGAVGMVELALNHLEQKKTITLDDERKAAMVSNLLVVLCGDHNAQPVVNTGTLYT